LTLAVPPELPDRGETLRYLREVTRSAHLAIENVLGLQTDDLTRERYRQVLGQLYGFWSTWEPQIEDLFGDEAFLAPRRRSHLLAADLANLGWSEDAILELNRCPRLQLPDKRMALGSIYVMEGSSLGGRVILRNVQRCLKEAGKASSSYFAGYGADTGRMWQEFLARLEQSPVHDKEFIGRGALTTFESFRRWIVLPEHMPPFAAD
jgi:heme oxygenase